MVQQYDDDFVERLRDRYEGTVRAVAEYDRDDYDLLYIDEETAGTYSPADRDEIYEDVVLEEIAYGHDEALFEDMGTIQGKLRVFEGGLAVHFWPDDSTGVFLAFDESADPGVRTLQEMVLEMAADS
jgi:hypothetical protein